MYLIKKDLKIERGGVGDEKSESLFLVLACICTGTKRDMKFAFVSYWAKKVFRSPV